MARINLKTLNELGYKEEQKGVYVKKVNDFLYKTIIVENKDTIKTRALRTTKLSIVHKEQIDDIIKLYHQNDRKSRKKVFLEKKLFFRLLIEQIADGYVKDDVTQMYYEMLSEYAPNDIQDEIERTQQRLDELKARVSNIKS